MSHHYCIELDIYRQLLVRKDHYPVEEGGLPARRARRSRNSARIASLSASRYRFAKKSVLQYPFVVEMIQDAMSGRFLRDGILRVLSIGGLPT